MDDDYVFTDADAALAAQADTENTDGAAAASGNTAREVVLDDRGVIVPQHTLWIGSVPANMNSEQLSAVLSHGHAHGTVVQVEVS